MFCSVQLASCSIYIRGPRIFNAHPFAPELEHAKRASREVVPREFCAMRTVRLRQQKTAPHAGDVWAAGPGGCKGCLPVWGHLRIRRERRFDSPRTPCLLRPQARRTVCQRSPSYLRRTLRDLRRIPRHHLQFGPMYLPRGAAHSVTATATSKPNREFIPTHP